ncbi:type II toxin-antitoxin system HipA family toxin [Arthrobacter roseus]|uniref:type II toxin-antitoxin system HipA family toxin n=1 Tax=Arthrobacter roseus TaxID=136274 RepID=UPI001964AB5F|nr:type II toxin-antitoxin system HipA family toxin [Arthrobacter roseus]MBM7847571.1 serine/threonine-protein kinase HipA [Arthrobacter roseus]
MTDVQVHVNRDGRQILVGVAHFTRERQKVTTTFTYESGYLADRKNQQIDPGLPLFSGNQYVATMPGVFGDSTPDRWGRNLLTRRERQLAAEEGRTARTFDAVDFLLGVNDETRQGALQFSMVGSTEMLSPRAGVPRLVELPALLRASDNVATDRDGAEAYKVLLAAGTASLGGARPKASVRLADGALAIAKFPHAQDEWDVMAWEALSLDLAERAGIAVPRRQLVKVGDRHVLLVERFDRADTSRIGYMSAMTMMEAKDGESGDYIDLAEKLADHSASLVEDRRELFDRAVLNVALHNTDDHLRNHGLVDDVGGWRLSPIFDVNPNPVIGEERATSIAGATAAADEWAGLVELASASGISTLESCERIARIVTAAESWREVAIKHHIPASEQQKMATALDDRINMLRTSAESQSQTHSGRPETVRPPRRKTTRKSNTGSFASRERPAPKGDLSGEY